MSLPVVSIMMPAYNAEAYIQEAIESCQKQTYKDWELCIVDDGSEDNTYEIALWASVKDDRVRVIHQKHGGCPVARNASLAMMTGDMVAKQDADDLQDPTRIEKSVNYLLNNDIDIVTCKMMWLLPNGEMQLQKAGAMQQMSYMKGRGGRPVNASIVAWKVIYDRVGGYDPNQPAGSDGDWNFRAILKKVRWGFIPEPLYIYRRHPLQITKRLSRQQRLTHELSRKKYSHAWRTGL